MEKGQSFPQMEMWEKWIATFKRMKLDLCFTYMKKLKWIKVINVRAKTMKLLEENMGKAL